MIYQDLLVINDGTPDTFFGVLAIITVALLVYCLGYAEIAKKRIYKAKEAKRIAVECLNLQKVRADKEEKEAV